MLTSDLASSLSANLMELSTMFVTLCFQNLNCTSFHGLFAVAVNWNSLAVLFFCSDNIVFCSSAKWGVFCLSHRKMVMMLSVDDPSVFP